MTTPLDSSRAGLAGLRLVLLGKWAGMSKRDAQQLVRSHGATVVASPSKDTNAGRKFLAQDPNHPGSLGLAISEAIEDTATHQPDTKYSLGSVFSHVLMHQTIIGEEALKQLADAGDTPDVIVGCTGGGSNFGGLTFPFLREKRAGRMNPVIRAVEPAAHLADLRGREAGLRAQVGRPPHGVDIDVVAGDVETLGHHVAGHLQSHGAKPDHAGAPRRIACVSHMGLA